MSEWSLCVGVNRGLGGQGKHFSFGKVFRFMSFKSLIESLPEDEGKELARWVLVLLWLLVAVLLARYSWWLMQVCGLAQLLEWLLPSKKEQVWPGEMLRRMQSQSPEPENEPEKAASKAKWAC